MARGANSVANDPTTDHLAPTREYGHFRSRRETDTIGPEDLGTDMARDKRNSSGKNRKLHRRKMATPRRTAAAKSRTSQASAKPSPRINNLSKQLKEALQQQTATADVLKIIASAPGDIPPVLKAIVESASELCEAADATVLLRDGNDLRCSMHHGPIPLPRERWPISRNWATGRAFADKVTIQIHDWLSAEGDEYPEGKELARVQGHRTLLCVPLLREDEAIGVIALRRAEARSFNEKQVALLCTFADQAVIAIENARLFKETREALKQQTATAEVLKVISRSAFDLDSVMNTLTRSAAELCSAEVSSLQLREGDLLVVRGLATANEAQETFLRQNPIPITRQSYSGRAVLTGSIVNIGDVKLDQNTVLQRFSAAIGYRAVLLVPLMRDGRAIGLFSLTRSRVGGFSEREVELVKTFADQAVIAIENARLFDELQARTHELAKSLDDLRAAQDRLIQTEKLASLGQLTAGIAHEIKNPLNFVNNFSAVSVELTDELNDVLSQATLADKLRGEVDELTTLLKDNLGKVVQHGKRADSIVKNMLLHSREGSGERRSADINALVGESLNLAYHGARAERSGFTITLKHDLDPEAGALDLYPQEITRALLNLISNGFYAATSRKLEAEDERFEPILSAATRNLGKTVEIRIRDNGSGIPPEVKEKIFNPFFTTKPSGEGTGLGLSMTHDIIVKQHGGRLDVETEPGSYTEFIITLPRGNDAPAG
jgi:two-component system NtrC family sensor kinase